MIPAADLPAIAAALLLLGGALLLWVSPAQAAHERLRVTGRRSSSESGSDAGDHRGSWGTRLACAMAAFAVAVMTPQPLGLLAAPVAYMAGRSAIRRLPGRQHQPIADSEVASSVELLAACLDAGAVPAAALGVTSEWLPGPLGEQLAAAAVAMSQGLDPFDVLPKSGPLAALGAVLRRSSRSGSSMSTQLTALAEELRAEQQFKRLEHARRVSVRSALPLGLCMLPAFVLLAVVPSVAGLGAGLLH